MALYHLTDGDRLRLPDYKRVAKEAHYALRQQGADVPDDVLPLAALWAEDAYEDLFRRSGNYRPEYLAHQLAQDAAIEYVKAKILGASPNDYAPYRAAAAAWQKRAAVEHHVYGATTKDTTLPLGLREALRDETGAYYEVDDDEAETP